MLFVAALSLALALLTSSALAAEVVSPAPEATALVIYPGQTYGPTSGLAMIVETRTVDLPAGPDVIRFRGVADTLVPQTAEVDGLPAPLSERDFDYDLLSPGSLLKRAVDGPVRLVRTDRKTGAQTITPAVVRAAPDGVVLQTAQGVEALGCSGAPEKLVFDRLPGALSDRPTLSARVVVPSAGRYTLTLRYLAGGFGWRANYVARIRPDGRTLDLNAWLTLQNQSGATLADAPVEVIAGRLALTGEDTPVEAPVIGTAPDCWNTDSWAQRMRIVQRPEMQRAARFADAVAMAPPPPPPAPMMALAEVVVTAQKVAVQGDLGDYKLYALPEPTTVAARRTKQVAFIAPTPVPFETVYAFTVAPFSPETVGGGGQPTRIELVVQNKAARGLGKPLPAGSAAVSAPGPDGRPLLLGQARVQDTPIGLPWRLKLGNSHAVEVAPKVVASSVRDGDGRYALTMEATLTNARDEPATVELRQDARPGQWRVLAEDARHTVEAGVPQWTLTLAPGERRTFRYRISQPV